jgi:hypothetical protein
MTNERRHSRQSGRRSLGYLPILREGPIPDVDSPVGYGFLGGQFPLAVEELVQVEARLEQLCTGAT